jgi:hypothetical protein
MKVSLIVLNIKFIIMHNFQESLAKNYQVGLKIIMYDLELWEVPGIPPNSCGISCL